MHLQRSARLSSSHSGLCDGSKIDIHKKNLQIISTPDMLWCTKVGHDSRWIKPHFCCLHLHLDWVCSSSLFTGFFFLLKHKWTKPLLMAPAATREAYYIMSVVIIEKQQYYVNGSGRWYYITCLINSCCLRTVVAFKHTLTDINCIWCKHRQSDHR